MSCQKPKNYLHQYEALELQTKKLNSLYCYTSKYNDLIEKYNKYIKNTDILDLKEKAIFKKDSLVSVATIYNIIEDFTGCFDDQSQLNDFIYTISWLKHNNNDFCNFSKLVYNSIDFKKTIDSLKINRTIFRTLLLHKNSMCK